MGVGDPTNSRDLLRGERRFVYVFHWQARTVWPLEHVTGIAATRRQGRERFWR
jgi:hypothetical protein